MYNIQQNSVCYIYFFGIYKYVCIFTTLIKLKLRNIFIICR